MYQNVVMSVMEAVKMVNGKNARRVWSRRQRGAISIVTCAKRHTGVLWRPDSWVASTSHAAAVHPMLDGLTWMFVEHAQLFVEKTKKLG
jgi:hypothetical protein